MPDSEVYWFADQAMRDDPAVIQGLWQPCLQLPGLCPSMDIWFDTQAECEDFIRNKLIPARMEGE